MMMSCRFHALGLSCRTCWNSAMVLSITDHITNVVLLWMITNVLCRLADVVSICCAVDCVNVVNLWVQVEAVSIWSVVVEVEIMRAAICEGVLPHRSYPHIRVPTKMEKNTYFHEIIKQDKVNVLLMMGSIRNWYQFLVSLENVWLDLFFPHCTHFTIVFCHKYKCLINNINILHSVYGIKSIMRFVPCQCLYNVVFSLGSPCRQMSSQLYACVVSRTERPRVGKEFEAGVLVWGVSHFTRICKDSIYIYHWIDDFTSHSKILSLPQAFSMQSIDAIEDFSCTFFLITPRNG